MVVLHCPVPTSNQAIEQTGVLLGSASGPSSVLFGALLLGFVALGAIRLMIASSIHWRRLLLEFFVVLLVVGMGATIWLADFERRNRLAHREGSARSQCTNNLRQIGMAMYNYHDAYGCLPPAHVADEEGRPMYSWRVLLLPFLEKRQLYEQFRLDEPWNSAHNLTLLDDMPQHDACYQCPADRRSPATATSYVMIVGPDTLSDGPGSRSFKEIRDGLSHTIAVVEVIESGIQWTEPRDLMADQISFRWNDPDGPGIGSRHPGGGYILLVDGSVTFVSDKNAPGLIRALTTIDGGEDVSALNEF